MSLIKFLMFGVPLIVLTASVSYPQTCPGFPGCLDPTFGNGGAAVAGQNISATLPISTAIQSDGKIVAMPRGSVSEAGHKIVRWNPDGSLDTSFGNGGIASFVWKLVKGPNTYYGNSNAIALQNVGGTERILVVGQAPMLSGNKVLTARLRIDRLMPDGSYDLSWGSKGTVLLDLSSAIGVAVQPNDQKIVTVSATYGDMIRLNSNGTLDSTFGSGGVVSVGDGHDIVIDPSGQIVVGTLITTGKNNNSRTYISVKRFLSNGSVDRSFGINGAATTSFSINNLYLNVRLDPFGNIVVASNTAGSDTDFAVERFLSNGVPDTSFGTNAVATADFAGNRDIGLGAAIQSDGKIIAFGESSVITTTPYQDYFALARFSFDGSLDRSFGQNGKVTGVVDIRGEGLSTGFIRNDPACVCDKLITTGDAGSSILAARFVIY